MHWLECVHYEVEYVMDVHCIITYVCLKKNREPEGMGFT